MLSGRLESIFRTTWSGSWIQPGHSSVRQPLVELWTSLFAGISETGASITLISLNGLTLQIGHTSYGLPVTTLPLATTSRTAQLTRADGSRASEGGAIQ